MSILDWVVIVAATIILLHQMVCRRCVSILVKEIERLKRGDFTAEEFQNLCHNFSPEDECRFKAGCTAYQEQLFGKKVG